MKLKFTYAAVDFRALQWARRGQRSVDAARREHRLGRTSAVLAMAIALAGIYKEWHENPHPSRGMLWWAFAVGAFIGASIVVTVHHVRTMRRLGQIVAGMAPVEIDIDETGIGRHFAGRPVQFGWIGFDRAIVTETHCFLQYTDRSKRWLVLPLRGLVNPSHASALRELVQRQVQPSTHGFPIVPTNAAT